ncbi:MAG: MaoC family dehydratase N-terminal domain-containing protein [Myxococcota bacterium]
MGEGNDPLRKGLLERLGQPLSDAGPSAAPDPVNLPMIRHWVDALDDQNPVYLDAVAAQAAGFDDVVAPPAMLQTWTMPRPKIEGIAERGGAPGAYDPNSPLEVLARAGYAATLATNSELEFDRYLEVGDTLTSSTALESISERKKTAIGVGYFVTWVTTYLDAAGEAVGRQRFRVFRFKPGAGGDA